MTIVNTLVFTPVGRYLINSLLNARS